MTRRHLPDGVGVAKGWRRFLARRRLWWDLKGDEALLTLFAEAEAARISLTSELIRERERIRHRLANTRRRYGLRPGDPVPSEPPKWDPVLFRQTHGSGTRGGGRSDPQWRTPEPESRDAYFERRNRERERSGERGAAGTDLAPGTESLVGGAPAAGDPPSAAEPVAGSPALGPLTSPPGDAGPGTGSRGAYGTA